jgi:hypothetical protein
MLERFLGKRPKSVAQVAAELPDQLNTIREILGRWLSADLRKKGLTSALPNGAPASDLLATLVACYVTGDPYDPSDPRLDVQEHEFASQMEPRLSEMVDGLLRPDVELREIVVTALRTRYALSVGTWGVQFANSPTGMHISDILDQYAGEFPGIPEDG